MTIKFDDALDSITQKNENMGIVELLRERETRRIFEEGLEKGKVDIVRNLIDKFGFNDKQAASAAEVSVAFVKKYALP